MARVQIPVMDLTWTLGDVIRKLRLCVKWKLRHLSEASNLDVQLIHRIEIGKTKEPTRATVRALADAFGLTARQLEDAVPPKMDNLPVVPKQVVGQRPLPNDAVIEKAARTAHKVFRAVDRRKPAKKKTRNG